MKAFLRPFRDALLLIAFWIICFDLQRILFSIHHWGKFSEVSLGEWLLAFVYSFRLDLATACALAALPFIFRLIEHYYGKWKWNYRLFRFVLLFLLFILVCVHAGETVAYGEWNHKLSSRVFNHLANPVEVARTASYGMIFWFLFYAGIQFICGWWLAKKLFRKINTPTYQLKLPHLILFPVQFGFTLLSMFLLLRGGWQQIPINIASAIYSNNAVSNDLSINSLYYFSKSYLQYNRSNMDEYMPKVNKQLAARKIKTLYSYPRKHDQYFLSNPRPNVVIIVLEGWSAEAIGCLGPTKGATVHFDHLAKQGVLFTDIYATATTSEIGNTSIFSGYPSLPETSISMQPDKHRKLRSINEDLESWGYHTSYIFSGDLKYGNLNGYFMDHGFDVVKDESDFPSDLPHGKLNFYDRELYGFLIKEINAHKKPFLQCAFTGSTHAPYDQPKGKGKHFTGEEADFMNSMVYADECLGEFMRKCKKYSWYKNTLFVFVADHGHATPTTVDPGSGKFYHIPLLFFGEPIKKEYRGKRMNVVGSQADIAATLITQMKGDASRYPFSKDLMNPKVPQFAFHTTIGGYGWVTPKGNIIWQIVAKKVTENTYKLTAVKNKELAYCKWFLSVLYEDYQQL